MSRVLVTIHYEVPPAKREAFLAHVREMREHAAEVLGLDYQVYEDLQRPNCFTEIFTCANREAYESLDEKQDDRFREMVANLDRYTDVAAARYAALAPVP